MSLITTELESCMGIIEKQRVNFVNPNYASDRTQQSRLESAIELLGDSEESLQTFSDKQQRRRKRVSEFLRNSFRKLGPEPTFLYIVSFSITDLADKPALFRQSLSSWWKSDKTSKHLSYLAKKELNQYFPATGLRPKIKV
jgi:hypothetical protein